MLADARAASRSAAAVVLTVTALALAFLAGRTTIAGGEAPVTPGPNRMRDGITVGFADTRTGAEAAAAHYLLELERAMDSLSIQRTSAVAQLVATPGEARSIESHAASVIALEQSHGTPLRRIAVSTDPNSYSSSTARITVLETWIYATSSQEALWAIEGVSLVWHDGDWRISAIDGAAPSENESLSDLRAQLAYPGPGDASVR